MRFIRALGAPGATTLLWAAGVSAALLGCGGPPEVAKSPEPVKVVWGNAEPPTEPDAPSAPEATTSEPPAGDERGGGPVEVDLDALPPREKASARESAPAQEAEEEPEPDSRAVSEPRAEAPLEKEMRAAVKSKEKKSSKPKKAVVKRSEPAEPAASTYAGPNACKAADFSVARVGDACAKGGRTAAKGVMKDAISNALASGTTLRCSDCHAEQRDYTLKPDAVAQLKKWLDG